MQPAKPLGNHKEEEEEGWGNSKRPDTCLTTCTTTASGRLTKYDAQINKTKHYHRQAIAVFGSSENCTTIDSRTHAPIPYSILNGTSD